MKTPPEERERKLKEATERAEKAKLLIAKYAELVKEFNMLFPPNLFGLTGAAVRKAKSLDGALDRARYSQYEPDRLRSMFADQDRAEEDAAEHKKQQGREEERKKAAETLLNEAVAWLIQRGKVIGKDFSVSDAIQVADGIAFQERVEKYKADGGPFSFDGQNCDDCSGWDGESNRCNCGNRRVSWVESYGHSFKTPSIQAEAH